MANNITDEDLELLDELGVEAEVVSTGGRTAREQRIIAGFEEIERFYTEHGRLPKPNAQRDIFERLYAIRLQRIQHSAECREVLKDLDTHGLLDADDYNSVLCEESPMSDDELLTSLGVDSATKDDVTDLVHVRSRAEIKAAEEIAQRNPCRDFENFKPLFARLQEDLTTGQRHTSKYQDHAEVKKGDLFILDGQKVLVAEVGESFVSDYGRQDKRLRVVYDNGTESDLLVRSLQRALNKDKASRRISDPDLGPLFSGASEEDDLPSGYIYVLRSQSDNPFVAENRAVIHKIGVTGGDVKSRLGNARKDPTYLLADVEVVATYKLANIHRKRLEALLHKFFSPARLDVQFKDRFGSQVEPREWFLVPLEAIEEAVKRVTDGTLGDYLYDPKAAKTVHR
jgi:hypothetical protein